MDVNSLLKFTFTFFLNHTFLSHGKTHSNKETEYIVFREAKMGSMTRQPILFLEDSKCFNKSSHAIIQE